MRQSRLSMRWSTPTLGARLACPSIRDRSDQARLIAATDCRKEASGAASNLGQPRNDLQVRMLNRRPGDQAMATCAGASCQTSTPSRQTQAWSEVWPRSQYFTSPGCRGRSLAVRALGKRSYPVLEDVRKSQCDITGRTGQPGRDFPAQQRSAVPTGQEQPWEGTTSPVPPRPPFHHLRRWTGVHRLAIPPGEHRQPDVVLGSAVAVAKGTAENTNGRVRKWLSRGSRSFIRHRRRPHRDLQPAKHAARSLA